ncbi:hypothetical protein BN938_2977 [Mucinivorans hirudinis]|uniref:Divergent 4Fe-4S mono-cluster domain-containing protein n=1 Tax=Mucinivorans hirudinis TaxID=1433126 RepID=A0A060RBS1_9BACT|nr:hypothetical protein BN938_2977 [Mucinivorans hirudinis]
MKSRNRIYTNNEIVVFWRGGDCMHSTLCFSELREVFDPIKRPWVNLQGAPTKKILDIIERCPSTALTFRWVDEARNESETSHKLFKGNIETFL